MTQATTLLQANRKTAGCLLFRKPGFGLHISSLTPPPKKRERERHKIKTKRHVEQSQPCVFPCSPMGQNGLKPVSGTGSRCRAATRSCPPGAERRWCGSPWSPSPSESISTRSSLGFDSVLFFWCFLVPFGFTCFTLFPPKRHNTP